MYICSRIFFNDMPHLGETISLIVAVCWTATALFADIASHRLGSMTVNVIRLVLASVFLGGILWVTVGHPYPVYADGQAWFWLALSALVGYVFGDFCLFNSYLVIGARFGQLFMTLAPPIAAIAGWILLGETMTWTSAFSYSRCTLMFCATALKLPVIVDIATTPGVRKFRYGSPCEVVWIPMPKMIRYIIGEIMAASVIL